MSSRLLVVAVAIVGLLAAPASAVPSEALPPTVPHVDALLNDAGVIARTTGLPLALVHQELQLQDAVGALQERAARTWPSTFAGLWVDASTGAVHVAFTRDSAANVATLAASFPRADLLRAHTFARSQRDLERTAARMRADRAAAGVGIDVQHNAPVVFAARVPAATRSALTVRYGPLRVQETPAFRGHDCLVNSCRYYMRAGFQVDMAFTYCATAFSVYGSSQTTAVPLSAGHCGSTGQWWQHNGETFGNVSSSIEGGSADVLEFNLTNASFRAGPWIRVSESEPARPVTGRQSYASLYVGQWICKAGATTVETCGQVLNRDAASGPYSHFFTTNMCDMPGDSGGAIYSGNTAVGIIHGGNGDTCAPGYIGFHSHIDNDLNALAVGGNPSTLLTSAVRPLFENISATGIPTSIAASGTVYANFSMPIECSSVDTSDFVVRVVGVSVGISGIDCSTQSTRWVGIRLTTPLVSGTGISVEYNGWVTDPGGLNAYNNTHSTTVG